MKISHNKTRGFTMIEIMVAIGVIVVLAAILITLVSGMNEKSKATSTQARMMMLGEAVEAFKQATGRYPLCVPEDAWGTDWNDDDGFAETMKYDTDRHRWTDYFVPSSGKPKYATWSPLSVPPTNIQMLTFQLEQVPESNSILERLKQSSGQIQQMQFSTPSGTETWTKADDDCEINTPLNPNETRVAFQPVDAWGTPLRFWTGDILPWAKRGGGASWNDTVLQLLSDRLQKANWGFFIESAGKDGRFGWWGASAVDTVKAQEAEDNLYKP
jgi:prepilin-type N-terminal cleavage/methylation domain-containing protein